MFAASLQSGLNALLALDPDSVRRLDRIGEGVMKLELQGTGIELYFTTAKQQFLVSLDHPKEVAGEDCDADAKVSGTPGALFSMAADELGSGWGGPGSKVSISGDAALARDFERLFSRLEPDFEGALSGLVGDVAGHQLAHGIRQGLLRLRETAGEAGVIAGEVFREGLRGGRTGPLVGSQEIKTFSDGVDELRDAVERLEARLRIELEARDADRSESS